MITPIDTARQAIRRDHSTGKTPDFRTALACAHPDQFPVELIQHAQMWLNVTQAKLGPCRSTQKPTEQQAAEFLSLAHWPTLHAVLSQLIADRTRVGGSYGWYIAHAVRELYDEDL